MLYKEVMVVYCEVSILRRQNEGFIQCKTPECSNQTAQAEGNVLVIVCKKFADSSDAWLCSSSVLTAVTRYHVQAVCWQLWHVIMFKQCADSCDTWSCSRKCADSCDTWSCSRSVLTAVTSAYVQEVCWQLWHTASCWSSLLINVAVSSTWLIRQHPLHVARAGVPWRHTRILPTLRI